MVWHDAQFVSPPWRLPWQLTQLRPGALKPLVWQRVQGNEPCGPGKVPCGARAEANVVIEWHAPQAPRDVCGALWQLEQARPGAPKPRVWQRSHWNEPCGPGKVPCGALAEAKVVMV